MLNDFDKLLGFHCAPTLMGIKEANLICCAKKQFADISDLLSEYNAFLNHKGLYLEPLWETERRVLVLVYQKKKLTESLKEPKVINFLEKYGYQENMTFNELLDNLKKNVSATGDFPHEIGVFLGYPIEDVEGFILNKGKNCQVCGCWKVYSDVENKLKLFEKYTKCRDVVCSYINRGSSIRQLMQAG